MEVIPSFHQTRKVGAHEANNRGFDNTMLRAGEVKAIIYPEDTNSRSKKWIEYDVLVSHRENGTSVTKLYHNCILANDLQGLADSSFRTLRVDVPPPGSITDSFSQLKPGDGSRVLLLCINGDTANAVIISGLRNSSEDDLGVKDLGHHLDYEFNGVHLSIQDDGSFSITKNGPTTPAGDFDSARGTAEANGTVVEVDVDGSFRVSTKDNAQSVVIDNKAGTITVSGDQDLTLNADTIHIGTKATEAAVLGNTLVSLLSSMVDAITAITHICPVGTSGPPVNTPAFKALQAQLQTALSSFVTVGK